MDSGVSPISNHRTFPIVQAMAWQPNISGFGLLGKVNRMNLWEIPIQRHRKELQKAWQMPMVRQMLMVTRRGGRTQSW
jgi:hypothetical protein